jgi:hypothetical protein
LAQRGKLGTLPDGTQRQGAFARHRTVVSLPAAIKAQAFAPA